MSVRACSEIAEWFVEHHNGFVNDHRLVSWARKLGIELDENGELEESQLFHLFVLAVLWNSKPTFKAELGKEVFLKIKKEYTLANFREAARNRSLSAELELTARKVIRNYGTLSILRLLVGEGNGDGSVWSDVLQILDGPAIGDKTADLCRLRRLYHVFNPLDSPKPYNGEAYFTVKAFLIFRELRVQFRDSGRYQYHLTICCTPDSQVREALKTLRLLDNTSNDINNLIHASEIVAEHFCNDKYELYDLPLFFWNREGKPDLSSDTRELLNLTRD